MLKSILLMFVFIATTCGAANTPPSRPKDSLCCRSYSYYEDRILEFKSDYGRCAVYATAWVAKARKEGNSVQEAMAYKAMTHFTEGTQRLMYSNMMVSAATKSRDEEVAGSAYLSRGIVYYEDRNYTAALDNYLKADSFIATTDNAYLRHKIKYQIGFTKYHLGYYQEAISLLRECAAYFIEENDRAYLNSVHGLSLCYNSTKQFKRCTETNLNGVRDSYEFDIPEMVPYFKLSEGINQYMQKNYQSALQLLAEAQPGITASRDKANEILIHFYLACTLWERGDHDNALPHLLKVDEALEVHHFLRPELLKIFVMLKEYYHLQEDIPLELKYINKLLRLDSIVRKDHAYLSNKIHSIYNVKQLLKEKNKLEQSNRYIAAGASLAIAFLCGTTLLFYRRHRRNRSAFRNLRG